MGLLSNLRVLAGSDIGNVVRELRNRVDQLTTELDDVRALSESRYRRLAKRQRDDPTGGGGDAQAPATNDRVARLLARRAARNGGAVRAGA